MKRLTWFEALLLAIVMTVALVASIVCTRWARTSQGPSTEIRFERVPGYAGLWRA